MNEREIRFVLRFKNEASRTLRMLKGDFRAVAKGIATFGNKLLVAAAKLDKFGSKALKVGRKLRTMSESMRAAGGSLTRSLTLPIAGAAVAVTAAGASFESAFAGIRKTVTATEPQFRALSERILQISDEIPVSANELAKLGEVAGQLGIEVQDIEKFATVIAKLGVTTNIVGDQGATQLARFLNITQLGPDKIDRLGATVVALGNNFAVYEAELVQISKNLAPFGVQIGLSADEILAFGTAIKASGGESQAAATAFQKLGLNMKSAVLSGNADLKKFASIAGVTGEQFQKSFKEDAAGALVSFLAGLRRIEEAGGDVKTVLEGVGLADVRLVRELGKVTSNIRDLRAALKLANIAWKANVALDIEAEKRFKTLTSVFKLLRNQIFRTAVILAEEFRPVIDEVLRLAFLLVAKVREWAKSFSSMSDETKFLIAKIGLLVALLGPMLIALSGIGLAISFMATGLGVLASAISVATIATGKFTAALLANPLGLALVAVVALTAALFVYKDSIVEVGGEQARVIDVINAAMDMLKEKTAFVGQFFADTWTTVLNFVGKLFAGFSSDQVTPSLDGLGQTFLAIADGIAKAFLVAGEQVRFQIEFWVILIENFVNAAIQSFVLLKNAFDKVKAGDFLGASVELSKFGNISLLEGMPEATQKTLENTIAILESSPITDLIGEIGKRAGAKYREAQRLELEKQDPADAADGLPPGVPDPEDTADAVKKAGTKVGFQFSSAVAAAIDSGLKTTLELAKDHFTEFIETGKFSFKKFIRELTSIFLDRALQNAIDNLFADITPGEAGSRAGGGINGILASIFGNGGGGGGGGGNAGGDTIENTAGGGGGSIFGGVGDAIGSFVKGAGNFLGGVGKGIGKFVSSIFGSLFSEGGFATEGRAALFRPGTFNHAARFQSGGHADRIPAMLNRTEAVVGTVPLPGGRGIPVDMRGGGSGGSNTFNVSFNLPEGSDASSFIESKQQISALIAREMSRATQRNG